MSTFNSDMAPRIHSRREWGVGATPARSIGCVKYVIIHHTATPATRDIGSSLDRIKGIYEHHTRENGWADIGYSFLIDECGEIYEGRGWKRQGAHTKGYNSIGYGISFIGDFSKPGSVPSTQALNSTKRLIQFGVDIGEIDADFKVFGHRDVWQTQCPGASLYREIQTWANYWRTC